MEKVQSTTQPPRLENPVRITEQVWPEGTVPVVSVFCITYNHAKFIREAIEGFLMQETTFPVEIFIHDDASTDGTAEIVKEYADKYPKLFWTVLQRENQWSKGNRKILFDYLAKQRGEFIALCEGDDYWTKRDKLQKQVGALQHNPLVVGCFHQADVADENGVSMFTMPQSQTARILKFADILIKNDRATATFVFRRAGLGNLAWADGLPMGDWPLQLELASKGHWFFLPGTMSVYRKHAGGAWHSVERREEALGTLMLYDKAAARFGASEVSCVGSSLKQLLNELMLAEVARKHWISAAHYLWRLITTPPWSGNLLSRQKSIVLQILWGSLHSSFKAFSSKYLYFSIARRAI